MTVEQKAKKEVLHTSIWREEPEPDNPFVAAKCFLRRIRCVWRTLTQSELG